MTKLLDQAVETTRGIAPERQDEIAHRMLFYADAPVIQLTPEEDCRRRGRNRARRIGDGRTDARHLGEAPALKLRYADRAARQIDAALDHIAERSPPLLPAPRAGGKAHCLLGGAE
jgi:hypothetical protein